MRMHSDDFLGHMGYNCATMSAPVSRNPLQSHAGSTSAMAHPRISGLHRSRGALVRCCIQRGSVTCASKQSSCSSYCRTLSGRVHPYFSRVLTILVLFVIPSLRAVSSICEICRFLVSMQQGCEAEVPRSAKGHRWCGTLGQESKGVSKRTFARAVKNPATRRNNMRQRQNYLFVLSWFLN